MSAYSILFLSIFLSRSDCLSVSLCLSLYKIKVKIVLPLSLSLSLSRARDLPLSLPYLDWTVFSRATRIQARPLQYLALCGDVYRIPFYLMIIHIPFYSPIIHIFRTRFLLACQKCCPPLDQASLHIHSASLQTHRWIFACDGFSQRCITSQTHTDVDIDTDADADTATATDTQHTHTPAVHARVFAEEAQHFVYIRRSEYCVQYISKEGCFAQQ